jgi:hypothetical protein
MKQIRTLLVSALAVGLMIPAFTANAANETSTNPLVNVDGKKVNVRHFEKEHVFTDAELANIVAHASQAVKEQKEKDKQNKAAGVTADAATADPTSGTYDYVFGGPDYMYVYEESPNSDPVLETSDIAPPETSSTRPGVVPMRAGLGAGSSMRPRVVPMRAGLWAGSFSHAAVSPYDTINISDGIGGKQTITLKSDTYMSAVLQLPTTASSDYDSNGIQSWNYGGFDAHTSTATYSGEMGLTTSHKLGPDLQHEGWLPELTMAKTANGVKTLWAVQFDPDYNKVQYDNGYEMGATINYYTYYNYNGYVRMKMTGLALCGNIDCSISTPTTLTTIMDTNQTVNLTSSMLDDYKLITSIVTPNNYGDNSGVWSSIRVGTTLVPSANFGTYYTDNATVYRDPNTNTVTITCDAS